MGRKIDMKKIEDITKCQVTFSKRRSSLIKKANEIAVCCDVDVAFIAFSPSGRVSKYCNQKRIEDVLHRYVNLPAERRLTHIENVQGKMEKLKHLSHIKGDSSKLHFLDKQIENLELQIKKCSLELQILEADLRDYEVPENEPVSLHQLSWCERNLNHSLEKVVARKNAIGKSSAQYKPVIQVESGNPGGSFSTNFNENELASMIQNPPTGEILRQLDPWIISPYSARVRESMLQDLLDQVKFTPNMNQGPLNMNSYANPSNICNFPFQDSATVLESGITVTPDVHNPFYQVTFSDAIHMSTQTLCNFQPPRFTSTTTVTTATGTDEMLAFFDDMETGLQFTDSNFNMNEVEIGEQSMNCGDTINMNTSDQVQAPNQVQPEKEICQDTIFDDLLPQDISGTNMVSTSKIHQTSDSWDWEDLLFVENFNFGDHSKK